MPNAMSPRKIPRSLFALVALAPLAAALAAATAGGCSSSDTASDDAGAEASSDGSKEAASSSDAAGDGTAADAGACKLVSPYSTKDVTCNDCAEARCCAEVNGCLGDTVCNDDYVNCLLACALSPDDAGPDADAAAGIPACEAVCDAQYPKGRSEYVAAIGCVDQKCKAECK